MVPSWFSGDAAYVSGLIEQGHVPHITLVEQHHGDNTESLLNDVLNNLLKRETRSCTIYKELLELRFSLGDKHVSIDKGLMTTQYRAKTPAWASREYELMATAVD